MFGSKCVKADILHSGCSVNGCLIRVLVVYGPGPLGGCSMSPVLVRFRFMVGNDPFFFFCILPNFISCTV